MAKCGRPVTEVVVLRLVDMALLRRDGWCESMCARAALARYGLLRPRERSPPTREGAVSPATRDDPVRAARALLRSLPIPSAEFAYGRTRVFVRSPRTVSRLPRGFRRGSRRALTVATIPAQVWELEALRAARVAALVGAVQRAWRRHRTRRRHSAQTVIARAWRAHARKVCRFCSTD